MIWLGCESERQHEWVERLPLSRARLLCVQCRSERPLVADWLLVSHHCPIRLEAA